MIASVALIAIPGIGTVLGAGLGGILALGVTGAQALGMGLMLVSSILLGPKMPKALTQTTDRLQANFDLTAPRKIVVGDTAMATDIRYVTYTGSKQEYYHQIIAVASHEIEAIDEIWLENEKAWGAGATIGRYVNYLTVATRLAGTAGNGIAIDGAWTANATLLGCAYIHLRFKLVDGGGQKNDSPFASGVTSRVTIRGKGARVYDPRLDTTVVGGSGAHRANDQTTWGFTTKRNPALQLLFYLLGWKINAKVAVGMGIPPARIDLPSFITGANICEELVTLAIGGTEMRYRSDGVLSEGDDRSSVIENLCATMNATLRDSGGKISLSVLKNDLAAPVATFTVADILGEEIWSQTPPLTQSFNILRGRYINATDTGLYQPMEFAEVKLTSLDGIDRIENIDFPLVQSHSQAQRLAKQRLQRNQYQGRYSCMMGPRAWQVNIGDVAQITHSGVWGTNKLFRLVEQSIARSGQTTTTWLEENAAIYAWDANEAPVVTPGAVTIYDPLNNPMAVGDVDATHTITYSATAPTSPKDGDFWVDTGLTPDVLKVRVSGVWQLSSNLVIQGSDIGVANGATVNIITYSATAPTSPVDGDIWVDTGASPDVVKARVTGAWQTSANLVTQGVDIGVENGASVDANIIGDNPVIVFADVTGTPKTGEISKVLAYKLTRLGTPLTTSVTWAATLISGNATFTISGTGTATLTITGPNSSALTVESVIRLKATNAAIERALDVKVLRQDDPPTASGGGGSNPGTTATTTTLGNATATSYPTGESAILTCKAGTAGQVACTAPLNFKRTPGTIDGQTGAFGKWQWRVVGGTFADITTEVAHSGVAETITNGGDPTLNMAGSISVSMTKGALTSGTDYEFKLLWRRNDVLGDVDNIYRTSGTMQAAGS